MAAQESGLHVAAAGPFLILEMDKEKMNRAALVISMPFTGSMSYGQSDDSEKGLEPPCL